MDSMTGSSIVTQEGWIGKRKTKPLTTLNVFTLVIETLSTDLIAYTAFLALFLTIIQQSGIKSHGPDGQDFSSVSYILSSIIIFVKPLHSKDPEFRLCNLIFTAQRSHQAQPKDAPCVTWGYHAVILQRVSTPPSYLHIQKRRLLTHNRALENTASLSLSILAFNSGSTAFPTVSITAVNCSLPITPILAFGHIHKKRGE